MSCDVELQELMIQVDKMVEENKMEWQEKIKVVNISFELHIIEKSISEYRK